MLKRNRPAAAIRALALTMTLLVGGIALTPAAAQFSDGYKFLEAIRKPDIAEIIKFLDQPGVTPINTKDKSTGDTALIISVGKRDLSITNYLLTHGARVDLANNSGLTPLMAAVEKRFVEGTQLLLIHKANPNQANNSGETPLMRAVQMRDLETVRLLMSAGADPNKRDSLAGMSAIDYAKSGAPVSGMIEALTAKQAAPRDKAVQGPTL